MAFTNFIKKYYVSLRQGEIISILHELAVYNDIEATYNEFYNAANTGNKMEIIVQLALTCSEFVSIIHEPLRDSQTGYKKIKVAQKITELTGFLINNTFLLSGLTMYEYSSLLNQVIKKTCLKHSWDHSLVVKLLRPYNIQTTVMEEKANGQLLHHSKKIHIDWQGSKPLDLFVNDLAKTFKRVKSKKQLYHLFDEVKTDFSIEVPSTDLLPILSLFYELHKYAVIKVTGNRGLYVYLKQHLCPPSKDQYPKRDFRKLLYEAKKNSQSKKNIERIINPMLNRYC